MCIYFLCMQQIYIYLHPQNYCPFVQARKGTRFVPSEVQLLYSSIILTLINGLFVGSLYAQHLGTVRNLIIPSAKPIIESYMFGLVPVATYPPSEQLREQSASSPLDSVCTDRCHYPFKPENLQHSSKSSSSQLNQVCYSQL